MAIMANTNRLTDEEINEQLQQVYNIIEKEDEEKRRLRAKYHREWRRQRMEDPVFRESEKLKRRTYEANVRSGRVIPKRRKPQEVIQLDDQSIKEFALEIKRRLERAWGKKEYNRMKVSGELDTVFYNILKDPFKYDIGDVILDFADSHFRLSAY